MSDDHALAHLLQDLDHDSIKGKIMHEVFKTLGSAITDLGERCRGSLDSSSFLTKPKQLSNGSALALLNEDYGSVSNCYRLLACINQDGSDYNVVVYREDNKKLSNTFFVTPSEEELIEIKRQLRECWVSNQLTGNRLFTLVIFKDQIEGYEYFTERENVGISAVKETRRGPTPVALSRQSNPAVGNSRI